MFSIFIAAYAVVFGAELLGDKTLLTLGTLAARYRLLPIFVGSGVAFMLKMLAAVLLGQALADLPKWLIGTAAVATFFTLAAIHWFKREDEDEAPTANLSGSFLRIMMASFAGIFFSEWGDIGQLATATMAARYASPFTVWLAAVLAMSTKGLLAATLGVSLRRWVPGDLLRYGTCAFCVVMGVFVAWRIVFL